MRNETPLTDCAFVRMHALHKDGYTLIKAAMEIKQEYQLAQAPKSIVRYYQDWIQVHGALPDTRPALPPELKIPYRDCLIMCDLHIPYVHTLALTRALIMAKERGLKYCVLNGDTFDFDWCSQYMSVAAPGNLSEVQQHIRDAYHLLLPVAQAFERVYVVRGNHDQRPLMALRKILGFNNIFRIFCQTSDPKEPDIYRKFKVTERYHLIMTGSPTGDWLLAHQKNYSSIPGRVAQRLAAQEEMNVVTSHSHDLALSRSGTRNGWYAVAGGCMLDPRKIAYKEMRKSLHPYWTVGWVVMQNGVPEIHDYQKEFGAGGR